MKMVWIRRILSGALSLCVVLTLMTQMATGATEAAAGETVTRVLRTVYDFEEIPSSVSLGAQTDDYGNATGAVTKGNLELRTETGSSLDGGTWLGYTIYGPAENVPLRMDRIDGATTDWSGGDGFLIYIDTSDMLGVADSVPVSLPFSETAVGEYEYWLMIAGSTVYLEGEDGGWEPVTLRASEGLAHLHLNTANTAEPGEFLVPAGYQGWVKVPLNTDTYQPLRYVKNGNMDLNNWLFIQFYAAAEGDALGHSVFFDQVRLYREISPEDVVTPTDLRTVWDVDTTPTTTDFSTSDQMTIHAVDYNGGRALKWANTSSFSFADVQWMDFSSYDGVVTNWTGATELWCYLDASNWTENIKFGIGIRDNTGNTYSPGRVELFGNIDAAYEADGQMVETTLNSWGWFVLPAGYQGWLRVRLTGAHSYEEVFGSLDMAHITGIGFKAEGCKGKQASFVLDNFSVYNGNEEQQDKLNGLLAWPEGKKWAMTFSYDDGQAYDVELVNIFNKYGMKGTFNLIGNRIGNSNYVTRQQVSTIYAGHEVANHTWSHPYLTKLTSEQQLEDIRHGKAYLEELVDYEVRGMAYPYGTSWYDAQVIANAQSCGMVYARTTTSTHAFRVPSNFMEWHATARNTEGVDVLNSTFERFISSDRGMAYNLYYLWGHSFEFAPDKGGYTVIEGFCKQAYAYRDQIWFGTNIEVYDYVMATRQVTLSEDGTTVHNGSTTTVWIVDEGDAIDIAAGSEYVLGTGVSTKPGDVNNDGAVTISDVRMALRAAVGKITLTTAQQVRADVTGDGKVSVSDVRQILRYVVGKINDFGS